MKIFKMIYEIKKEKEIQIFDSNFIKRNKKNCLMIIENKIKQLNNLYVIKDINMKYLKVKLLIFNHGRLDLSYMFNNISSITKFYINSKLETIPIPIENSQEYKNKSLKEEMITDSIYDDYFEEKNSGSKIQTQINLESILKNDDNITSKLYGNKYFLISEMINTIKNNTDKFIDSQSLIKENYILFSSLIFHSKRNNIFIVDLNNMFNGCKSLIFIFGLSDLDISNVSNMSSMFKDCNSLLAFSDISKWKTNNVTNISYMFNNCFSLKSLPDLSNWNTNNIKYMNNLFAIVQH